MAKFEDLLGKTITRIGYDAYENLVEIVCSDGSKYHMYHEQDCCEEVRLEDPQGDFYHVLDSPVLLAEVSSKKDEYDEWTFYKLVTNKGYLTMRWCADTDTYYSTEVSFKKVT